MSRSARLWDSEGRWRGAAARLPEELLLAPTPRAWFDAAPGRLRELLLDHANCEKKAASTALALMFSYAEDFALTRQLSRLAREELRHFEQVQKYLESTGVPYRRLKPSRYAEGLRGAVASAEPQRRLDLLLCGALIEARSCERFAGLVPKLEQPLSGFYDGLRESEARHFMLYLGLARTHAERCALNLDASLETLACAEAELATAPDRQFRFHSGEPVSVAER
jgi:tRNA 2-(methylsulfanyl)-N6-isopentenyladenosine37 hydroxylase